jgi:hypothetical protein
MEDMMKEEGSMIILNLLMVAITVFPALLEVKERVIQLVMVWGFNWELIII